MKISKINIQFNLIKSFGVYTLVNIFHSSIPLLLPFILSSLLLPKDFGILSNINSLFSILVPFIGFSAASAIARQFVKKEINVPIYMGNVFILSLFNSLLFYIIILIFKSWLINIFKINELVIHSICIYALTHNIMEMVFSFWRMQDDVKKYSFFRISKSIIELILSLVLIFYIKDWQGRYYSIIGCNIVFTFIIIFFLISSKQFKIKINLSYLKHIIIFGLPLIPHALSGVLIMYADKLLITNYISIEQNGIYSISFQIGMIISLIQNSFNQAWVPWFFKKIDKDKSMEIRKKLVRYNYLYFVLLMFMLFCLLLLSPLLFTFLGKEYSGGIKFVGLIGFGFVLNGMYKMLVNYIFYFEKNKYIFIVTIVSAVTNILLNFYLIPKFGVVGGAYSFVLTCFIELILTWIVSHQLFPLPWFYFLKSKTSKTVYD